MTETQDWLKAKIAEETGDPITDIDIDQSFESFQMDSLASVSLAYEIEQHYDMDEINPTVFDEYDTIRKLSAWLEEQQ
jgi:acyl carrier protein